VTATPPSTLHASGARRLVSVQEAPPFTAGRHHPPTIGRQQKLVVIFLVRRLVSISGAII